MNLDLNKLDPTPEDWYEANGEAGVQTILDCCANLIKLNCPTHAIKPVLEYVVESIPEKEGTE
jgi:hypothetical protein